MILNLYRIFQFIGNCEVIQYFVTIVKLNSQWLGFHIRIWIGKNSWSVFSLSKRLETGKFFEKRWLELQL